MHSLTFRWETDAQMYYMTRCIYSKILFRYGELIWLSPGGGGRCGRGRGMDGQDGLRAGADAR